MSVLNLLNSVRNVRTKEDKAYLIDEFIEKNKESNKFFNMIFDKDVRFFVHLNKINSNISPSLFKEPWTFETLYEVLYNLSKNELRGHEGVTLVNNFIDKYLDSQTEVDMLLDILENKMRLGIAATDINKYSRFLNIEQFEVMFALQYDKAKFYPNKSYLAQPKIDGHRCICKIDGIDNIKFFSRTGKEFTSLDHIKEDLQKALAGFNIRVVLDGEIENEGSLESTGKIRRKNETIESAVYTIFGKCSIEEWDNKNFVTPYWKVLDELENSSIAALCQKCKIIESIDLGKPGEDLDLFKEKILDHVATFLDKGYEGGVIKTVDHLYQPSTGTRRSNDWIKIKPWRDADATILDIILQENSNDTVGKFYVDWAGVKFHVSPGVLTHKQRKEIWANKEHYIGKKLNFKFVSLTKYTKPREARALRIRED